MNGPNVTAVKAALALQGLDCGATRPPSAWPLTEAQARLRAFMEASGPLAVAAGSASIPTGCARANGH